MTQETKNKIKDQIDLLPKDSQQAIASFDWMKETEKIAEEYNIFDIDCDNLIIEVVLVLCGIEYLEDLSYNIAENVEIEKVDAEEIVKEIIEKIIKPIAEKRIEIIKQNIKNNPQPWDKEMKFVLSGGDYSHLGDRPTSEALREGINKNIVI